MRIVSLASGSSGNCTLIVSEQARLLIDAGISRRQVLQRVERVLGLLPRIDAILLTHEHTDHTSGVSKIARALKCPIYTSEGTAPWIEPLLSGGERLLSFKPGKVFQIRDLAIMPFRIPHDAAEPCGFVLEEDSLFQSITARVAIATDLGTVTEEIRDRLVECDLVMLEANHDLEMLRNGSYPEDLKQRILSDVGHLSNDAAAQTLHYLAQRGRLRAAVLMHLSKNNNRPMLALKTVQEHLNGTDVSVAVAPRDRMSAVFTV
ncbi:Putative metallo-hydrolase YycJ [bacterium HR07]|uniref:Beta-lactamase domain protein n=1 Tax=uncultured Acetothermia bacterium TaxID=236499 RepID=H5SP76_9BACT|nr:beta-lactamase domain protein [uncultured Acetothermia bacterium]GBC75988.1 Putative metallo-hydrolase YycJ [bacterium HR07]